MDKVPAMLNVFLLRYFWSILNFMGKSGMGDRRRVYSLTKYQVGVNCYDLCLSGHSTHVSNIIKLRTCFHIVIPLLNSLF
jgi:hypothetical protein